MWVYNIAIHVEDNAWINAWYFTYSAIYGLFTFLVATFLLAIAIYPHTVPTRYTFI